MQVKRLSVLLGFIGVGLTVSLIAQNAPPAPPGLPNPGHAIPPRSVATRVGTPSLAFDSKGKEYSPKLGEAKAPFVFSLTNISDHEVVISNATTSCGCTVAKLPSIPWHLAAKESGEIKAEVNLAGKFGTVVKGITINTSEGVESLTVTVHMPPPGPAPAGMTEADRQKNMQLAAANQQAVFQNADCAVCHVKNGEGKYGGALYAADCGICHDSMHRASSVPDLHNLPHPTDAAFWKTWIADSQPGKMMPAFAQRNGGPLNDAQIDSVVAYMTQAFPSKVKVPAPIPAK